MSSDYEKSLKETIWLLHKHMNLSFDEINNMTVADRRLFTVIHNKITKEEDEKMRSGLK